MMPAPIATYDELATENAALHKKVAALRAELTRANNWHAQVSAENAAFIAELRECINAHEAKS